MMQRQRAIEAKVNPATARPVACVVVLLRHGYSEYNEQNLFTGWTDAELTNRGKDEARIAGSMLREMNIGRVDRVYSSLLKRAIKTAWLMLDGMDRLWVPVELTWRLNERHYGALQGRDKRACSEAYGLRQVQKWRRGPTDRPPPIDPSGEEELADRRYAGVDVPASEALCDCAERMRPFLRDELWPAMREAVARHAAEGATTDCAGAEDATADSAATEGADASGEKGVPTFVVVSSENLIRALIQELDDLSDAEIPLVDIPYATPLIYQMDADLTPLRSELATPPLRAGWYVGDPARVRNQQVEIREQVDWRVGRARPSAGGADAPADGPISREEADEACIVPDATDGGEYGDAEWVCTTDGERTE